MIRFTLNHTPFKIGVVFRIFYTVDRVRLYFNIMADIVSSGKRALDIAKPMANVKPMGCMKKSASLQCLSDGPQTHSQVHGLKFLWHVSNDRDV